MFFLLLRLFFIKQPTPQGSTNYTYIKNLYYCIFIINMMCEIINIFLYLLITFYIIYGHLGYNLGYCEDNISSNMLEMPLNRAFTIIQQQR